MSFTVRERGSFDRVQRYLERAQRLDLRTSLETYAKEGVRVLALSTPKDSGLAAGSWTYEITGDPKSGSIIWKNTDVESGFNVAIAIQYGYSTGTGGYVQGRDYINPAMRPIFDRMAKDVWKEVSRL